MEPRPSIVTIIVAVARFYGETPEAILGRARHQPLAFRRQIAMALARRLTQRSFPVIGAMFHRYHSTVLDACRRVAAREHAYPPLAADIAFIATQACESAGTCADSGELVREMRAIRERAAAETIARFARALGPVPAMVAQRDEPAMRAAWLHQVKAARGNRDFQTLEGVNGL